MFGPTAALHSLFVDPEWRNRRLGRAGAQPQGPPPEAAAQRADRHHRAVRLRQVEPCLRHDLRRGPAPLRRVAVGLRAPVPGPDGQARRRLDRGPLAGDLDRPEDHQPQPALDGRHRHRDLRLPAPALGPGRPSPLLQLRPPDRGAVGRADHRPGDDAPRGHEVHGAGAGRARAQGRVRQALRGAARAGLHAREGRRRAAPARGGDRPRQEVQARHRGRDRPARDAARPAQAAGRLDRDRRGARRGAGRRRARRRPGRGHHLQRPLHVPALRHLDARARAAHVLLQLAARRLPALHRARLADGDRPRADRPRPVAHAQRRRDPALVHQRLELLRADDHGDRRQVGGRHGHPLGGPPGGRPPLLPVRHQRREDLRLLPQPLRPPALVHDRPSRGSCRNLERRYRETDSGLVAREDRGVHDAAAVPRLQGGAAAARVAGGQGRRARRARVHAHVGARGRSSGSTGSSCPTPSARSPG